jgi:hypothetical protein
MLARHGMTGLLLHAPCFLPPPSPLPFKLNSSAACSSPFPRAGKGKVGKLKGEEIGVVDSVAVVGNNKDKDIRQANIRLRFNRNPVIGGDLPAMRPTT